MTGSQERAPTWQIITDLEHAKELHPQDCGVYEFGVKLEA